MTQDEEIRVTYLVRELVERIERKLDDFHRDLDHKANQTDFDELDRRLDRIERANVTELDHRVDRIERWMWKAAGAVAVLIFLFH